MMIKKSILVSIALFVIWLLVISFNKGISSSQHQWQDNYAKAEAYLYADEAHDQVIVGSSLANRIITDSLPNFYNLSFAGLGTYDGLVILPFSQSTPTKVFIEVNVLDRFENKVFTEALTSPVGYNLKKHVVTLRSDKQPLGLLKDKVITPLASGFIQLITGKKDAALNASSASTPSVFRDVKDGQIERYSKEMDEEKVAALIENLSEAVHNLEAKNIEVIFFEMPVHPEIAVLNLPAQLRDIVQSTFPGKLFIPAPSNLEPYQTTDGLHLSPSEALKYTAYLKGQIEGLE